MSATSLPRTAWYERLLGEPTSLPRDSEAVWTLADHGSVYVVKEPGRAGQGVVLLFVDDLGAQVAEIASRGIDRAASETYANGFRKVVYRDPDGNELAFGGAPVDALVAQDSPGSR